MRLVRRLLLVLVCVAPAFQPSPVLAGHGVTTLVTSGIGPAGADGNSRFPAISGDGRFVAFESGATNIVPGDTNASNDVFVHDRMTGVTERVSVSGQGTEGDERSGDPTLSADGRFVSFYSEATNLVPDDTNGVPDVFVRDRIAGTTVRASVTNAGDEADATSSMAAIAADGRSVTFSSDASNLVAGDANGVPDVFVRDLAAGRTVLVSVRASGDISRSANINPSISADGRFVAFESWDRDMGPGAEYGTPGIFLRDMREATTERVSVGNPGVPLTDLSGYSVFPTISGDGRLVVFSSQARLTEEPRSFQMYAFDRVTRRVEIVSLSDAGERGNQQTLEGVAVSHDGRFVAFYSDASNLVPDDLPRTRDVFLRDRLNGLTTRVSVTTGGRAWHLSSQFPAISADGRVVAFSSLAPLDGSDRNRFEDVFVHDAASSPTCPSDGWAEGPVSGSLYDVSAGTGLHAGHAAACDLAANGW